ncbi:hypothetical protein HK405_004389 [Cladochytrium tenue]|nr:hypothetical protein HK405_004389 [Cladochytrium tenue]
MGADCCKPEKIDFDAEVELGHFDLLRSVGKGAFGKVRIVQHKNTKKLYALKYINKQKCIQMKASENIICERNLLEEIHNAFICNLRFAFQDDENLFMVLDLMLGGDLRFHLDRLDRFPEDMMKFYAAEISSGLIYLHSKRIVHRDLKPDNVLVDECGHASLTDFNIAVRYREEKPLMAVAGSMAYMAPEVLLKKGYFEAVDWWSLGVMLFEFAYGKRPFRGKTNEDLTKSITTSEIELPEKAGETTLSKEFLDLMGQFLQRDLSERLGAKQNGGDGRIMQHDLFKDWNWADVETKKIPVPFVPDSKRANFDATHELEELLLEENPLRVKPRKKRSSASSVQPVKESETEKQMRILDERFLVFDYTKIKADETAAKQQLANGVNRVGVKDDAEGGGAQSEGYDHMEGRHDAVNFDTLDPESPASAQAPELPSPTSSKVAKGDSEP